jgi:phosphatidylglycerol---prolipoprotein diacylglyceryl transferase
MYPVLWRIPIKTSWMPSWVPESLPIHGYGLMLFFAFILCTWMASRRAEREGIRREIIQDLAIWLFIGGLLGARLTYLLAQPGPSMSLLDVLIALPKIWDGGLVLYGSVIGGLVAYFTAYFLFFRRGLTTLRFVDVIAPAFTIGLALGRFGCFLNGCCFGGVVCASCFASGVPYAPGVPFPPAAPARYALVENGWQTVAGFTIDSSNVQIIDGVPVGAVDPHSAAWAHGLRSGDVLVGLNHQPITSTLDLRRAMDEWPRGQQEMTLTFRRGKEEPREITFVPWTLPVYPTQLYEVVSMLLLFLVLTAYYPLRRQPGQVMALLMIGYGAHRYLNEILRIDARPIGLERYISVVLVGGGALLWLLLQYSKPAGQTWAEKPATPEPNTVKSAVAQTPS